jgi:hypothetical protein
MHKEPQIENYWNTNIQLGPLHAISFYISYCRFEQIKRFFYILDAKDDIRQRRDYTDK